MAHGVENDEFGVWDDPGASIIVLGASDGTWRFSVLSTQGQQHMH